MSGDGFARGHQLARVLGVGIPLAIFLVWWSISGNDGDVVAATVVSARIIADEGKTALVLVDEGKQVRILKPRNAAKGDPLRMTRTQYESGELRYTPLP
jgi:hypothetical protein